LPADEELEILVFAPASLKLPHRPRIRRVDPAWPAENPIVRALWEKWVLPGILKAEQASVLYCQWSRGDLCAAQPRGRDDV
jgi:hypothetical protein